MRSLFKLPFLAAMLSMASYGVCAEKAATPPAKAATPPAKAPATLPATPSKAPPATLPAGKSTTPPATASAVSSDLQRSIQQFNIERDAILAERAKMTEALKSASEAESKKIKAEMQAREKTLLEGQRALGKQIREDMRKLRQAVPASPPGSRR